MMIKNPPACICLERTTSSQSTPLPERLLACWLGGSDGCDRYWLKSVGVTDLSVSLIENQARCGR